MKCFVSLLITLTNIVYFFRNSFKHLTNPWFRSCVSGVYEEEWGAWISFMEMEDDLDDHESDATPTPGTYTKEQLPSDEATPDPDPAPPSRNTALPWCKCGVCEIMLQEIENKCCTQ